VSVENDSHNADLVAEVERYIDRMGWGHPDLVLTDVVVIATRRGFDRRGGKSVTTTIVPTESDVPMTVGMLRYSQMRFEKVITDSFVNDHRPDEE